MEYRNFSNSDEELQKVMTLVDHDLSEPYSVYIYRHFMNSTPQFCYVAEEHGDIIGCIICNVRDHRECRRRGYIAMLAVKSEHRGKGIATKLTEMALAALSECTDEIVLETEVVNTAAIKLYQKFGFIKTKRFYKYYLNGNDAFRLILPITEKSTVLSKFLVSQTTTDQLQNMPKDAVNVAQ